MITAKIVDEAITIVAHTGVQNTDTYVGITANRIVKYLFILI